MTIGQGGYVDVRARALLARKSRALVSSSYTHIYNIYIPITTFTRISIYAYFLNNLFARTINQRSATRYYFYNNNNRISVRAKIDCRPISRIIIIITARVFIKRKKWKHMLRRCAVRTIIITYWFDSQEGWKKKYIPRSLHSTYFPSPRRATTMTTRQSHI